MDITVPQYAIWHDGKEKRDVPVVIVQAEMRGAVSFIGFKRVAGGRLGVAPLNEFRMLGTAATELPRI
jgi:hypothetical protein